MSRLSCANRHLCEILGVAERGWKKEIRGHLMSSGVIEAIWASHCAWRCLMSLLSRDFWAHFFLPQRFRLFYSHRLLHKHHGQGTHMWRKHSQELVCLSMPSSQIGLQLNVTSDSVRSGDGWRVTHARFVGMLCLQTWGRHLVYGYVRGLLQPPVHTSSMCGGGNLWEGCIVRCQALHVVLLRRKWPHFGKILGLWVPKKQIHETPIFSTENQHPKNTVEGYWAPYFAKNIYLYSVAGQRYRKARIEIFDRDWNFQARIENFDRDWIFSIAGPSGSIAAGRKRLNPGFGRTCWPGRGATGGGGRGGGGFWLWRVSARKILTKIWPKLDETGPDNRKRWPFPVFRAMFPAFPRSGQNPFFGHFHPKDPAVLKRLRHNKFTMHSKFTMAQWFTMATP